MTDDPDVTKLKPVDPDECDETQAMPTPEPLGHMQVGKYTIKRKLGSGAMGEVWLAHNPDLDVEVAVKTLPTHLVLKEPGFVERFSKEARTAARINHTNVVHVYDCGIDDDVHYIVMEYVDGGNVRELQEKINGPMELKQALDIVTAVTEALCEAATYNIIHRDIKPENIMLDKRGTPKLADLGLAKIIDNADETGMTGTGVAVGTPKYIAPEQVQDAKNVDARADIYSLGATFYHLVTGEIPFEGSTSFEMMLKHVEEQMPNPREKVPELPEDVCAVIYKMTEKSPESRYQTAEELLVDLKALRQRHAPDPAELTVAAGIHVPQRGKIRPAGSPMSIKLALAAAVIVIIALTAHIITQSDLNKPTSTPQIGKKVLVKPKVGKPEFGKPYTVADIEIELIPVKAGTFKMGCESKDARKDEKPAHAVKLSSPFWMAKYETTHKQFAHFCDAAKLRSDSERQESTRVCEIVNGRPKWTDQKDVSWRNIYKGENRAVVCLTWRDAIAFGKWLTKVEKDAARLPDGYEYRLPTEAEWEYCYRAGTTTEYFCGDDRDKIDDYAWTANNTTTRVHIVGDAKPNPWGFYDIAGNASEWCLDFCDFDRKQYKIVTDTYVEGIVDPLCVKGKSRIYRGGNWTSPSYSVRAAYRSYSSRDWQACIFGFRVVLAPIMTDKLPEE